MKTLAIGLVAAAVLGGALVYRSVRRDDGPVEVSAPSLSSDAKSRIREFWASYRRARALKLEGRWREATSAYRDALALDPDHEGSLYDVANCHFELGEFAAALDHLQRLVAANPQSHRGHQQMGLVRSCPLAGPIFDLEAAREEFERAFELNREQTGSLLRLGEVALVEGKTERALELFTLVNQANRASVEAYWLRAYIVWRGGHAEEARKLLTTAIEHAARGKPAHGVPGEGDTKGGRGPPPSTLEARRLMPPLWSGIGERLSDGVGGDEALRTEFESLEKHLESVRARRR